MDFFGGKDKSLSKEMAKYNQIRAEERKKMAMEKAKVEELKESVKALYEKKKARLPVLQGDSSLIQIPDKLGFIDGAKISAINVFFDECEETPSVRVMVEGMPIHLDYGTAIEAYDAFEYILNDLPHGRGINYQIKKDLEEHDEMRAREKNHDVQGQ